MPYQIGRHFPLLAALATAPLTFLIRDPRLDPPFGDDMLAWPAHAEVDIDNLGGNHSHLYRRVMASTGIEPAGEPIPPASSFPAYFRDHPGRNLDIYRCLRQAPERIRAR